ncbi:MAG: O-antigen ligase family protein [Pseudomonadota bacterium]
MTVLAHIPNDAKEPPTVRMSVWREATSGPVWEQTFVTLWFALTYVHIPELAPLRYLCILGFIVILAIDFKRISPIILKCWPLFLLPILGIFSVGWSPYPDAALRTSILYFLTPLVVVIISCRLNTTQILRAIMFAGMFTTIYSIPYFATFAEGGPYDGKNIFAISMLFCLLLSTVTALNSQELVIVRLIAIPFIPICFLFQLLAESATSLVFAIVGLAVLLVVKVAWTGMARVQHLRSLTLLTAGLVVFGVVMALALMPGGDVLTSFLDLVGKDATFTGRSQLWTGAEMAAQDRPWLGVGVDGFWHYDTGLAQTLNENNFKDYGTKLTFHNAFLEVRVHLGWIGLALFVLIVVWCTFRIILFWLSNGTVENSGLLLITFVVLTAAFTESYLWGTFIVSVNLFYLAGIVPFRIHERREVGVIDLPTQSENAHKNPCPV